jgi:hypothetical protein
VCPAHAGRPPMGGCQCPSPVATRPVAPRRRAGRLPRPARPPPRGPAPRCAPGGGPGRSARPDGSQRTIRGGRHPSRSWRAGHAAHTSSPDRVPGWGAYRHGRGVKLLPRVSRDCSQQVLAQGCERAPQPAHPMVERVLRRNHGEVRRPRAADLVQEGTFAWASEQVANQRGGEHLGIRAGRRPAGPVRHQHRSIREGIIDEHRDMDE